MHRKVAEAMESLYATRLDDHVPALAHHWARASGPGADPAKAVRYATRAGDRALAQLAHDEAVTHYGQALDLLDLAGSEARRPDWTCSSGWARRSAGPVTPGTEDPPRGPLPGLRTEVTPTPLPVPRWPNNRGFWSATRGTVDADRVAALEAALRRLDPGDSSERARLLANFGRRGCRYAPARSGTGGRALSDEAPMALARRLGGQVTLAGVLLGRCSADSGSR